MDFLANIIQPIRNELREENFSVGAIDDTTLIGKHMTEGCQLYHFNNKRREMEKKNINNEKITQQDRIEVWEDTKKICEEKCYIVTGFRGQNYKIDISGILTSSRDPRNTKHYPDTDGLKIQNRNYNTMVKVVQGDCVDVAIELRNMGLNPVVLNHANEISPGGGYKRGAASQEESIIRRSNYLESLDSLKSKYPLDEFGGIYSGNVLVMKSSEKTGFTPFPVPITISCIAVSAYNNPICEEVSFVGPLRGSLNARGLTSSMQNLDINKCENVGMYLREPYKTGTEEKIKSILKIGLVNGHDSIVLGAFGCGAFGNPPKHIAALFEKVLSEFKGFYREVIFAIIDDHNAFMNCEEGNLAVFARRFNRIGGNIPY